MPEAAEEAEERERSQARGKVLPTPETSTGGRGSTAGTRQARGLSGRWALVPHGELSQSLELADVGIHS